jgi:hypothetical protein
MKSYNIITDKVEKKSTIDMAELEKHYPKTPIVTVGDFVQVETKDSDDEFLRKIRLSRKEWRA